MQDEATRAAIKEVERRVTALEVANRDLREALDVNTTVTTSIKQDTAGLVEFAKAAQGIVTVGRWIGRVLRLIAVYVAPIVLAVAGMWAALKGKNVP